MPKGKKGWGKRLLATAFGMAAGVLVATGPTVSNAQSMSDDYRNYTPIAAPVDLSAYRHPTLASASTEDVGVLLVLAMDSSGSMSDEEWRIQLRATAAALVSTQVRSTIRCKSGDRSVAIAVVDFADQPRIRIPWVDLRPTSCSEPDPEFDRKIELLAAEIAQLERRESGSTHIGNLLQYSLAVFTNAPWKPTERRVLDVSGDGSNNGGVPTEPGRQALMDFGVTINGVAIVNDDAVLDQYYRREIISNTFRRASDQRSAAMQGQVWVVARNMQSTGNSAMTLYTFGQDVENALKQKISMEVAGIYDPVELGSVIQTAQGQYIPPVGNDNNPERDDNEAATVSFILPRAYALR